MSYYENQGLGQWPAPKNPQQPPQTSGWDHQTPPARSGMLYRCFFPPALVSPTLVANTLASLYPGSSSAIPRDDPLAFVHQIEGMWPSWTDSSLVSPFPTSLLAFRRQWKPREVYLLRFRILSELHGSQRLIVQLIILLRAARCSTTWVVDVSQPPRIPPGCSWDALHLVILGCVGGDPVSPTDLRHSRSCTPSGLSPPFYGRFWPRCT